MLAKRIDVTSSKIDLFSEVSDTGTYEVVVYKTVSSSPFVYMTSNSSGTTSNSIELGTINTGSIPQDTLRFNWDSATPLYVFTSSGTREFHFMLTPVGSTNVNLSVGPCS